LWLKISLLWELAVRIVIPVVVGSRSICHRARHASHDSGLPVAGSFASIVNESLHDCAVALQGDSIYLKRFVPKRHFR
jgi:hypothetical protein